MATRRATFLDKQAEAEVRHKEVQGRERGDRHSGSRGQPSCRLYTLMMKLKYAHSRQSSLETRLVRQSRKQSRSLMLVSDTLKFRDV